MGETSFLSSEINKQICNCLKLPKTFPSKIFCITKMCDTKKHWDKTVTILLNPDLGQAPRNMLGFKYKLVEISALRAPYRH